MVHKAVWGATLLVILSVGSVLAQADPARSAHPVETVAQVQQDSSRTAIDWHGVYRGILPCTECDGVETTLTLRPDHSYTLTRQMLGAEAETEEVSGSFLWAADGGGIMLNNVGQAPGRYKIGENRIWQLDDEGKELSEKYALEKIAESSAPPLEGTRWALVELAGSPVLFPAKGAKRPYFVLDANGAIRGFAGCNSFSGKYKHHGDSEFDLFELTSTMMACPQLELEQQFLQAVEAADRYHLVGTSLFLYQGDALLTRLWANLSEETTP